MVIHAELEQMRVWSAQQWAPVSFAACVWWLGSRRWQWRYLSRAQRVARHVGVSALVALPLAYWMGWPSGVCCASALIAVVASLELADGREGAFATVVLGAWLVPSLLSGTGPDGMGAAAPLSTVSNVVESGGLGWTAFAPLGAAALVYRIAARRSSR